MRRHPFAARLVLALAFLLAYAFVVRAAWRRDLRPPRREPVRGWAFGRAELLAAGGPDWREAGRSREGRPIWVVEFGSGSRPILLFGGFHGDELNACRLARAACEWLRGRVPPDRRVVLLPLLNPDGLARGTRTNASGVDVNRNFPTENWRRGEANSRRDPGPEPASEPETRLAMEWVERLRPDRIVSIHEPLRVNNYDGPAEALARAMAAENGYRVSDSIGYPTPGSFGTWAGIERGIPTVTLEIERGLAGLEKNLRALEAAVRH